MNLITFRKGDAVPEWVLDVTPRCQVEFGADVIVQRNQDGITVSPRDPLPLDGVLVKIHNVGTVKAVGAPTHWMTTPDAAALAAHAEIIG